MKFELQFPASEIAHWACVFRKNDKEMSREKAAFGAGNRLSMGEGTPMEICEDLYTIGIWKASMALHLLRRNASTDILEACRIAVQTSNDACAVAVLRCLQGVAVPMASALLTTMNPERYTVIDWRALEALKNPKEQQRQPTIGDYLCYLNACRALAKDHAVSLRKLDQALWAWSKYGP